MTALSLPIDLYSPDQLSLLVLECDSFINAQRQVQAHTKTREHSHRDTQKPVASEFLQVLFDKNKVEASDLTALESLHKALKVALSKARVVHLTVAVLPGRTFKRQMTVWFRTQVDPLVLLTFTERRDIGGGVIARAGSHVYDFSFQRRILDNKQRISELAFADGGLASV